MGSIDEVLGLAVLGDGRDGFNISDELLEPLELVEDTEAVLKLE